MKYKRILLKLSGESLQGSQKYGLSPEVLQSYAEQIRAAAATGVQIGIVVGGGNFWRGRSSGRKERLRPRERRPDGHARHDH